MNETLTKMIIFGAGVGVGIISTKTYFENKYKKIADDEIESMKEVLERHNKKELDLDPMPKGDMDISAYEVPSFIDTIEKSNPSAGYVTFSRTGTNDVENYKSEIYPITSDEFIGVDEEDGFEKVTLSYYKEDETLVNEDEEIVPIDIHSVGSLEILDEFSEGVQTIYIRNEYDGIDFEIIGIAASYKELIGDDI